MFSVDLVICTYNNARLLEQTLGSLMNQQVPPGIDWRILVVNNNCTDSTPHVVERFAQISPAPLRIVTETEQGLTPARARGVRETNGDWIAFIDDDCLPAPDWISQAAAFGASHPQCGAFGSRIRLQWESPPPSYVMRFPFAYAGKNHGDSPKRLPSVAGLGLVIRRTSLEATGWTKNQLLPDRTGKRLISGGDVEICFRIGSRFEIWYNPLCEISHIIPAHRFSRSYLSKMFFGLAASRHNSTALLWRGSYLSWLPFSALYSLGILLRIVPQIILELPGPRSAAIGPAAAFSHFTGWWAAIIQMWRMDPGKRHLLLGAAKKG